VLAWLIDTLISAMLGLAVGALILLVLNGLSAGRATVHGPGNEETAETVEGQAAHLGGSGEDASTD